MITRQLNIRGIRYLVQIWGSGSAVLMLHGFTGSGQTLANLAQKLSGYQIIAPDLIGHGGTDAPTEVTRYSPDEQVADMAALLDALHVPEVRLFGYSMGGRLALAFALVHQHRVTRLVLESASPGLRSEQEQRERRASDASLADRIMNDGVTAFVDFWGQIPLFASQQRLSAQVRAQVRAGRICQREIGLVNSLLGFGTGSQPSFWNDLPRLSLQTTLLVGELDEKYCQVAAKMAQIMPRCVVKRVPHVGHTVHLEALETASTILSEAFE